MPEISIQPQCATLNNLVATDSFGEPIGDLPNQTDSGFFEEGNMLAGTWECEPGKIKLDLDLTEFCHLLIGRWILTSESGQVTEIKAGDSLKPSNLFVLLCVHLNTARGSPPCPQR